jgi:hypothetical protein
MLVPLTTGGWWPRGLIVHQQRYQPGPTSDIYPIYNPYLSVGISENTGGYQNGNDQYLGIDKNRHV